MGWDSPSVLHAAGVGRGAGMWRGKEGRGVGDSCWP